ncbi:MAG: hypothetical protein NQU42_08270 [Methanothrix sp.]|uniref:hypothetical protein n=1 Tax=Methanothrix sp. TaxID=90426 RepID=UPI0025F33319|nr:hypothetical protein [Methanothrix sp.]MCQ8904067.1 hypothetical protein [Methanothrix sp.]
MCGCGEGGEAAGYGPKTRFEDGLARTVDWYLSNRRWVEGVITGEYLEYCRRVYG